MTPEVAASLPASRLRAAALQLAYDPSDVRPGWIALLLVLTLAVATYLLWRSMNTQLRKIQMPPSNKGPGRGAFGGGRDPQDPTRPTSPTPPVNLTDPADLADTPGLADTPDLADSPDPADSRERRPSGPDEVNGTESSRG